MGEHYRVELPTTVRVWADNEDEAWRRGCVAILGYLPRRKLSWWLRALRPRWMGTVEGVGGFGTKVELMYPAPGARGQADETEEWGDERHVDR